MTEILIVARTRIGADVCVGGLRLDDNANVRLMTAGGAYQPARSQFRVGEVYEMTLGPDRGAEPPHIENVRVRSATLVRQERDLVGTLTARVPVVHGHPRDLFDRMLQYTSTGRPYVGRGQLPGGSVAFWMPDRDLQLEAHDNTRLYRYPQTSVRGYTFTYAGLDPAISAIAAGTLVRISLARWWPETEPELAQRCYTQVSGWF